MRTKNAMQLKAMIKKVATAKNISPQLAMQNYMLERILARIEKSPYRSNFILKYFSNKRRGRLPRTEAIS